MVGNGIYVDPDGLLTISIKIKRMADEIDQLHRSSTMLTGRVLSMNNPRVTSVPGLPGLFWTLQEETNRINYLANVVVPELSNSAYQLTRIAKEVQSNMASLRTSLQPPTSISPISSSLNTVFKKIESIFTLEHAKNSKDYLDTYKTINKYFKIDKILQDFLKTVEKNPDKWGTLLLKMERELGPEWGKLTAMLEKDLGPLSKLPERFPILRRLPILDVLGIVLNAATQKDPKKILPGIVGDVTLTFTPGVDEIYAITAVVSVVLTLFGGLAGLNQDLFIQAYKHMGGNKDIESELQRQSKYISVATEHTDISPISPDIGQLVIDRAKFGNDTNIIKVSVINSVTAISTGNWSQVPIVQITDDVLQTVVDTAIFVISPIQLTYAVLASDINDDIAFVDNVAHTLPIPAPALHSFDTATLNTIRFINDTAEPNIESSIGLQNAMPAVRTGAHALATAIRSGNHPIDKSAQSIMQGGW